MKRILFFSVFPKGTLGRFVRHLNVSKLNAYER